MNYNPYGALCPCFIRRIFMPKTIFGTTEKSNFILNMKYDTVRKWIAVLLFGAVLLPALGGAFMTFSEKAGWAFGVFLYAAGFSCVLFYIVLLMRKDIQFKQQKAFPAAIMAIVLAVLAVASYYGVILSGADKEYIDIAVLGEIGRYEGLLAIFAYLGIFLLAASVLRYSTVKAVLDALVGIGIIQAIVAVMQHIPWGFPSHFRDLPAFVLLEDVHLSSGFADNPIFYGSFITIVLGTAVIGALYEKNTLRARIYGCGAALIFLTGLFTSSVVPLIGSGCVIVITAIIELAAVKGGVKFDNGILRSSRKRFLAVIASFAAIFGIVFAVQGINLMDTTINDVDFIRDKTIAYTDAYNRLFIIGSPSPLNPKTHWEIGAERSFTMIKEHPILGIGPDLMAKRQANDIQLMTDSLDKSYNEYLYIAATRGIPSLIVYLALLFATFGQLFKGMKEFKSDREKWFRPAILTAVIAYSIQAFFSASAVTVAPFFWLLMGFAWSGFADEAESPRRHVLPRS